MIGGVLINGSDIFLAYGAFLADGGFAGLAKWPPVKKVDYNDWQEYDGIEPDLSDIRLDSVTFPLTFCVGARGGGAGALEDFYALLCSGPTLTLSHGGLGREFALRLVGISDLAYAMRFSRVTATFANDDFMAGYSYAPPVPLAVTDGSVEIDSTPVSAYGMRALAGTEDTALRYPDVKPLLERKPSPVDGAEYDSGGDVTLGSKDITLELLIRGAAPDVFWRNYLALLSDLVRIDSGASDRTLAGSRKVGTAASTRTYRCYYKSQSVRTLAVTPNGIWARFAVTMTVHGVYVGTLYAFATEDGRCITTEDMKFINLFPYGRRI